MPRASSAFSLVYCEGTKAYRLMCVETKKIIKCRDVTFLEDGGADPTFLEMSPSGSSGGPTQMVGTTPRVPMEDDGDEVEEQGAEDEELVEPKKKVATPQVKRSSAPSPSTSPREQEHDQPMEEQDQPLGEQDQTTEEPRYPSRTWKPLGDWWLNHILPPQHVDYANVAFLGDPSTLGEEVLCGDASKWELAMQEECKAIGTPLDSHVKLPKLTGGDLEEVRAEMHFVPCKATVGGVMCAMVGTRSDLAFPLNVVSQHMPKYGPMQWAAVKSVRKYLQGTPWAEVATWRCWCELA